MYLKLLFYILILVPIAGSAQQSASTYSVKAFLPGLNGKEVQLFSEGKLIHAGLVTNDMVSFNGNTSKTQFASIRILEGRSALYISFFIEPGLIRIRQNMQKRYVASGTRTNDDYTSISAMMDSIFLADRIWMKYARTFRYPYVSSFVRNNPSSYASVKLIDDVFYKALETSDTLYYSLFRQLDPELQSSFIGKKISDEVFKRYATAVGNEPPLLMIPDSLNVPRPVYEKGRMTLLTFWASWCLPCRKDIPLIQSLSESYSAYNLKIVGVSVDTNRSLWKQMLGRMPWGETQLCDGAGFPGKAASAYGVTAIPSHFLLDEEGRVIAKNVSIEELGQVLAKQPLK